jgi:hypothetical protein
MIIALSLFVEFIFSWLDYSSLSIQNILIALVFD